MSLRRLHVSDALIAGLYKINNNLAEEYEIWPGAKEGLEESVLYGSEQLGPKNEAFPKMDRIFTSLFEAAGIEGRQTLTGLTPSEFMHGVNANFDKLYR